MCQECIGAVVAMDAKVTFPGWRHCRFFADRLDEARVRSTALIARLGKAQLAGS